MFFFPFSLACTNIYILLTQEIRSHKCDIPAANVSFREHLENPLLSTDFSQMI